LGAFAWVGQADPGGQTLYACDQIPFPENGWEGQNAMGWCNEAASTNIKLANNTLVKDDRIAAYKIVQQEFTKDVPSIPLFNRTETFAPWLSLRFAPGWPGY
jgi:ABC-type transport system substrate-binding protein